MTLILWMYLMVPTQACLDKWEEEAKNEYTLMIRPRQDSKVALAPKGAPSPITVELRDDCYDIFVASTVYHGVKWEAK